MTIQPVYDCLFGHAAPYIAVGLLQLPANMAGLKKLTELAMVRPSKVDTGDLFLYYRNCLFRFSFPYF